MEPSGETYIYIYVCVYCKLNVCLCVCFIYVCVCFALFIFFCVCANLLSFLFVAFSFDMELPSSVSGAPVQLSNVSVGFCDGSPDSTGFEAPKLSQRTWVCILAGRPPTNGLGSLGGRPTYISFCFCVEAVISMTTMITHFPPVTVQGRV